MSLRRRLLLVFASILVIVAAGGATGATLAARRDRDNTVLRDLTAARRRVDELSTTFTEQQNAIITYLVGPNGLLLEQYRDGIATSAGLERDLRSDLEHNPDLRKRVDAIESDARWLRANAADPVIRLVDQHRTAAAVPILTSAAVGARYDALRAGLRGLGADIGHAGTALDHHRSSLNRWFYVALFATLGAVALATVVAAFLMERWAKRPIDAIAAAARSVQQGALDTVVPAVGPPELAARGRDVDRMRARIIRELSETVRAREAIEQNAAVVLTLRRLLEPGPIALPADWNVAAGLRPAEGVVAGDSYDVARLADGRLSVVMIDIAGHGAVQAVAALRCQELLRIALSDGREPGDALGWLHEQIAGPGAELFFSAFVATVDTDSGVCRYANAGHPSPLVATDGALTELGRTGPIVGPLQGTWTTETTTIPPASVLAIYTDGLTDPRNVTLGDPPVDHLVALIRERGCSDAQGVVTRLLDELETAALGRLRDDVTLLLLCRSASADGA
jgi:serine phosphatase RsbU (regulator of sigma subunit)/CHASE3 domain sensor protein